MSRKAEELDKKAILIKVNRNDEIIIQHFNKCYFFNDKYSVRKDGFRYYCNKEDDFYNSGLYCLVINEHSLKEALFCFIDSQCLRIEQHIQTHNKSIKNCIESQKKLINYRKAYERTHN